MRHVLAVMAALLGVGLTPAGADAPRPPGTVQQDCQQCPQMVVIGPGSFTMGESGHSRETPLHPVTIGYSFAISRYDVTFDEWDACTADGGCTGYRPNDFGWGRGQRPVINVSWDDAQNYVLWLNHKTGKRYRLPSEAEWEYASRAGATTVFWWGNDIGRGRGDCDGCGSAWDNKQTAPVGSFAANPFGVYDAVGNVTIWVEDVWNATYQDAPQDGSAREIGDGRRRVMRGGSWFNGPLMQHAAYRNGEAPRVRNGKIGFRVAVTL